MWRKFQLGKYFKTYIIYSYFWRAIKKIGRYLAKSRHAIEVQQTSNRNVYLFWKSKRIKLYIDNTKALEAADIPAKCFMQNATKAGPVQRIPLYWDFLLTSQER